MNLKEQSKCLECNGKGELDVMERVYPNEPHMAPIGSETCDNCHGTGIEPDEQIILERIYDNLSDEDERKLQEEFNKSDEFGGRAITKDNCEGLFEMWLEDLDLEEVTKILK